MSARNLLQRAENLVWGRRDRAEARWKTGAQRLLQTLAVIFRDITQGQLTLRAMGLVYTTLLSLVPLLALSFSVLKAFGVHNHIQPLLQRLLAPLGADSGEVTDRIIGFIGNMNLLVIAALTFAYHFVPNTRVHPAAALLGGIVAGSAWQTAGWGFVLFAATSGSYEAIYSGFAILILFLIWLYLSWLILLVGASRPRRPAAASRGRPGAHAHGRGRRRRLVAPEPEGHRGRSAAGQRHPPAFHRRATASMTPGIACTPRPP